MKKIIFKISCALVIFNILASAILPSLVIAQEFVDLGNGAAGNETTFNEYSADIPVAETQQPEIPQEPEATPPPQPANEPSVPAEPTPAPTAEPEPENTPSPTSGAQTTPPPQATPTPLPKPVVTPSPEQIEVERQDLAQPENTPPPQITQVPVVDEKTQDVALWEYDKAATKVADATDPSEQAAREGDRGDPLEGVITDIEEAGSQIPQRGAEGIQGLVDGASGAIGSIPAIIGQTNFNQEEDDLNTMIAADIATAKAAHANKAKQIINTALTDVPQPDRQREIRSSLDIDPNATMRETWARTSGLFADADPSVRTVALKAVLGLAPDASKDELSQAIRDQLFTQGCHTTNNGTIDSDNPDVVCGGIQQTNSLLDQGASPSPEDPSIFSAIKGGVTNKASFVVGALPVVGKSTPVLIGFVQDYRDYSEITDELNRYLGTSGFKITNKVGPVTGLGPYIEVTPEMHRFATLDNQGLEAEVRSCAEGGSTPVNRCYEIVEAKKQTALLIQARNDAANKTYKDLVMTGIVNSVISKVISKIPEPADLLQKGLQKVSNRVVQAALQKGEAAVAQVTGKIGGTFGPSVSKVVKKKVEETVTDPINSLLPYKDLAKDKLKVIAGTVYDGVTADSSDLPPEDRIDPSSIRVLQGNGGWAVLNEYEQTYLNNLLPNVSYKIISKKANKSKNNWLSKFFTFNVFAQESTPVNNGDQQTLLPQVISAQDYAIYQTGQETADKFDEDHKITESEIKQLYSSNLTLAGSGLELKNSYILKTGSDGTVQAKVNTGLYLVETLSVSGMNISVPAGININKQKEILSVGLKEGTGEIFKINTDLKKNEAKTKNQNEESDLTVAAYYDENGNGVWDKEEHAVPLAGIVLTIKKQVRPLYTPLLAGWNLFTLASLPSKPLTASGLLKDIATQQGYATTVSTLNDGVWQSYVVRGDKTFSGDDFPIEPGKAYFVKTLKKSAYVYQGQEFAAPVKLAVKSGWNAIGIPKSSQAYTAAKLLDGLNNNKISSDVVSRWESGLWESLLRANKEDFGNDYRIANNRGYIVKVDTGGEFSP